MPGQSVTMIHISLWNKHKGKQQQQKTPHHTISIFNCSLLGFFTFSIWLLLFTSNLTIIFKEDCESSVFQLFTQELMSFQQMNLPTPCCNLSWSVLWPSATDQTLTETSADPKSLYSLFHSTEISYFSCLSTAQAVYILIFYLPKMA